MIAESNLDGGAYLTQKLANFPSTTAGGEFFKGTMSSLGVVMGNRGELEFTREKVGDPLGDPHLRMLLDNELVRRQFGRFPHLKVDQYLLSSELAGSAQAITTRLRESPFKLHYYHQTHWLLVREIPGSNTLTLLDGKLVTKLFNRSRFAQKQHALPGEIAVGHQRPAGATHITKVEKGSIVLFRREVPGSVAHPANFRDDLLVLFLLNATPLLTASSMLSDKRIEEFEVNWSGIDLGCAEPRLSYCGQQGDVLGGVYNSSR